MSPPKIAVAQLAILLGVLAFATRVRAQDADSTAAARRALIETAQQARDAGDRSRALDLALRAGRLRMSASLRRFIAEEQSALGENVGAMTSALLCVGEAERDPTLLDRDVHLAACRALVATLSALVGRVVLITPVPTPPGLRVRIGDREVPEALWGVPYVVVPGAITVHAEVDGRIFHRDVPVRAGDATRVTIELPDPVALPPAPAAPTEVSSARAASERAHGETADRDSAGVSGLVVAASVGVLGFAAAGVFGALRQSAITEARGNGCSEDGSCPDAGVDPWNRATNYTIAVNASLVVGGVGVLGVGLWWLLGRTRRSPPQRSIGVVPHPGGGELVLLGRF